MPAGTSMTALAGRRVLVFGASGIVGGAVARGLLDAQATVIAPCRSEASKAKFAAGTAGGLDHAGLLVPVIDHSTEQGMEELTAFLSQRGFLPLDCCLACLGGHVPKGPLSAVPAAEVKEVLEARVLSQVLTGRFILPLMRQDAASCYLITTGRLGESCPAPEWAVYTMANAATYGVVSALRAESGVRVQELRIGGVIRDENEPCHPQWPDRKSTPASELVPLVCEIFSGARRDDLVRWVPDP